MKNDDKARQGAAKNPDSTEDEQTDRDVRAMSIQELFESPGFRSAQQTMMRLQNFAEPPVVKQMQKIARKAEKMSDPFGFKAREAMFRSVNRIGDHPLARAIEATSAMRSVAGPDFGALAGVLRSTQGLYAPSIVSSFSAIQRDPGWRQMLERVSAASETLRWMGSLSRAIEDASRSAQEAFGEDTRALLNSSTFRGVLEEISGDDITAKIEKLNAALEMEPEEAPPATPRASSIQAMPVDETTSEAIRDTIEAIGPQNIAVLLLIITYITGSIHDFIERFFLIASLAERSYNYFLKPEGASDEKGEGSDEKDEGSDEKDEGSDEKDEG